MTTLPGPQSKKPSILLNIIAVIVGVCFLCIVVSATMQALGLLPETPESTPFPTIPPPAAATPTIAQSKSQAQQYVDEYGGSIDAYNEILLLTDCTVLQEKFNIASDNNSRADAGADEFRWTMGYMIAADERMKQLSCY